MDLSLKFKSCEALGDMAFGMLVRSSKTQAFDDQDTVPEPTISQFPVNCPKSILPSTTSGKTTRLSSQTSLSLNSHNHTCSQFEHLADLANKLNSINKRLAKSEDFNKEILNENLELTQRIQSIENCELEVGKNPIISKAKCPDCLISCELF